MCTLHFSALTLKIGGQLFDIFSKPRNTFPSLIDQICFTTNH